LLQVVVQVVMVELVKLVVAVELEVLEKEEIIL
jgi:hypothetical protein